MPRGFRVSLGRDSELDRGDYIRTDYVDFTSDRVLGTGSVSWSGTWWGRNFENDNQPGSYYLDDSGDVYFVPDNIHYGIPEDIDRINVNTAPSYTPSDGVVSGTSGDDVIDETYSGDTDGDEVDDSGNVIEAGGGADRVEAGSGADSITGGAGDDTLDGGAGDDTIEGGSGDDSIAGGAGDDLLYGDSADAPTATSESLNWSAEGWDGANIAGGFTQNTGEMNVTVDFRSTGDNTPTFEVESSDTQYVGWDEPMDTHSSAFLFGQGYGATSRTTIDFAANSDSAYQDSVENVQFRINDVDWGSGNHRDIVRVNAYDEDDNPVDVSLSPGWSDWQDGNTVIAGNQAEDPDDAGGSLLVEIGGPVSRIEIDYANDLGGTQGIWVTDVHFDTIPELPGDDTLAGGTGSDTMHSGGGDDTFHVAQGDSASGGDGDDTFVLKELGETGSDAITITGGDGDQDGGDTLDLGGVADRTTLNITGGDDTTGYSGTVDLHDGSTVSFSEIENIICFTPGTRILTASGPRPVETLRPGDMVITRDDGPQPLRWTGARRVPATGKLAPIRLDPAAMTGTLADCLEGAKRPLLVSPQHRFLLAGYRAELLFGERELLMPAKHLVDGQAVRRMSGGEVTYVHLMFDRHQVIEAEGAATESFHLGDQALEGLTEAQREEIFALFPHLRADPSVFGPTARICTRRYEAELLAA